MLLDQSKFRERFDGIKAILGLTDVECKKIFTINRLENKEGRSFSGRCSSVVARPVKCTAWKSRGNAT